MALSYLLQKFDALGPLDRRAMVRIDQSFTGSTTLVDMFQTVLGTDSLTINVITDLISRSDEQLVLVGTTSVLHLTDAQATLTLRNVAEELFAKLEITVPSGWKFSDSFPDLPEGKTLFDFGFVDVNEPHFVDQLSLGASRLVFSNIAHTDEASGCNIVPGLNFIGELYFLGVLHTLGFSLLQEDAVPLTGPVQQYRFASDPFQFTGIRLSAPFHLPISNAGPLAIKSSRVFVKAALNREQVDYEVSATQDPGIYLLLQGELTGRPLDLVGKYDYETGSEQFSVRGRFTDFAVSGFFGVSQSVGVDGLATTMPEGFPAPEGLSITEFGVTIHTAEQSVTGLLLGLGCQLDWAIVPDVMTLREISATFYVTNPFAPKRSIRTSLAGLLTFKKFSLATSASFPDYEFVAGLPAGQTLPLGDVIESLLPQSTDLPDLTITKLVVRAEPKTSKFALNATIENLLSIPVGATAFEIAGFSLAIAYEKSAGGARGALTTRMKMADTMVVLSGELNRAFTLSGSIENFELKKFWALVTNGDKLPAAVPDILLKSLRVSFTPKTGVFSASGQATIAWDFAGDDGLSTDVQFTFSRTKVESGGAATSAISASISLQGTGPVSIAPGLDFGKFNFLFDYRSGSGWKLSGGISVDLFKTALSLQAAYETTSLGWKFLLQTTATPAKKLISLDGIGSYSFQQFDFNIERRLVDGKKKTFFDLRLASRLEVDELFAIDGYLSIVNSATGQRALLFKPNPGAAGFDIKFPAGAGMGVKTDVFEVGFVKESDAVGWTFSGTVNLGFHDFPAFLGQALPSKVTAKFVAGKNAVRISAVNPTEPVAIPFPKANGKDLGKAFVQLTEIGIEIKPQLGLVIEAGLGLPTELNTYLGTQLFRVYQQGNPTTMSRTRFTISGTGVTIQFIGSPFASANGVIVNNETWFDVDLGPYGALRLKMPTFIYDGVSQYFEAGGGIQITRTLALPLAPLRMFLEACGAKEMAEIFPKKIPIDGLVLVDSNNDLEVDEFVTFLKKAGDVPNAAIKTLKQTGKLINRFPDGFKQYFNLQVPDSLEFKFGFSPAGRISMGLLALKKPVRVLFPCVVQSYVPMPGLCGIEVRKFTVGTLAAGSLLYGEIDATLDQFDLPSLVVSLALPRDESFPLPTSDQLQRRIILDDVFCIIPISAGVPVPIPLFYDEIGFQYVGVEGIGLQAHVAFPKPDLGAAQATAMFRALEDFTNDPKVLLDPKAPPGGVDLAFTFHDEYLQAPEYLGGKLLGTKGKNIKVGTWKNVASMMNFCKTFSINDCIQAIPLEQRVGSAQYKFAFLSFDADWMLTTPGEFRGGAFQHMKLSQSDVQDFIAVLPSVALTTTNQTKSNEEGLVAFARGQANVGFMRVEAALGLAASGSMGFNTGFKFEGAIGKIVFQLQGAIMVNAPYVSDVPQVVNRPMVSTTYKPRSSGKVLALNGQNAWIEIPANDSLVLPEYTIELWLRSAKNQVGEWVEVFGADTLKDGNQRNHYLEINTKKAFYHHRFKDAKSGNSGAPNTPDGSVTWNEWQHVVLTNDGKTAKTFVDGKEVARGPVNGSLVLFKEPIFIGKVPGAGTNKFWKGEIAEVRIWKSVRDVDDIEEFMREALQGDEKDLVSCYQFDDDTGNQALDLCGRNHGTIKNGAFVDSDFLRFDGLEFDGKSTYIQVPDAESLRIGPYTAEVWFKPFAPEEKIDDVLAKRVQSASQIFGNKGKNTNTKPPWAGIFGKTGRNYSVIIHRNGFVHHRFHTSKSTNDGAPNTADDVIEWNQWNHVAITNDGKTARTYLNGVQLAEGPVEGNNLIVDAGTIVIGRTADAPGETFAGEIAEVRLWSGARSARDIKATAYKRLAGNTPNLVSLWRLGDTDGDTLVDTCGKNHGKLFVKPKKSNQASALSKQDTLASTGTGAWAPMTVPGEQKKASIQVLGHTHIDVLGHRAMSGDLRLVDSTFWFSGELDLFPRDWPIRVYGHVEGMVSKNRFFLTGETQNQLFGMTLQKSRLYLANDQIRLEGQWLGLYTLLDVSWDKDNPLFVGAISFRQTPTIDFGAIRMGGVKVADNVRLAFEIGVDVAVKIAKSGFSAMVKAAFTINGKGFTIGFAITVAPNSIEDLVNWIKTKILEKPLEYLAHLFSDAATWLENVGKDAIEFSKDVGEAVGGVLKSAFKASKEQTAVLMKSSGYAAHQVGAALGNAYGAAAQDVAGVLKGAGYAAEDVGHALQSVFSQSAEDAAKILKGAGYAVADVGKALGTVFGKGVDECEKLMKAAGFDAKDVSNALKSVGNVGKSIEKGVVKSAKKLKFW